MFDQDFENIPIEISSLPRIEDMDFHPIEERYARVLYLTNTIFFAFLFIGLIIFIVTMIGFGHWLSYLLLFIWLFLYLFTLWFSQVSVRQKAYLIRQHDVSFKSGVFFKEWITIPFNRVQHCEVTKGFIDNLFRLAELNIFTAGGSSSDIRIPGLDPEIAFQLKELIIGKISSLDEEE